jgi:hypothetical protein
MILMEEEIKCQTKNHANFALTNGFQEWKHQNPAQDAREGSTTKISEMSTRN